MEIDPDLKELSLEKPIDISVLDHVWMEQLGCSWPQEQADEWLTHVNQAVRTGSQWVSHEPADGLQEEILAARKWFYGLLPKIEGAVFGHKEWGQPIESFVKTMRTLHEAGVDAGVATDRHFSHLWTSEASGAILALAQRGLDIPRVLEAQPFLVNYSEKTLSEHMQAMESLGLDPVAIGNIYPSVLGLRPETVESKLLNIAQAGFDAVKLVKKVPSVIGIAEESFNQKIEALKNLGIDPVKFINANPRILNLAEDNIALRLAAIKARGIKAKAVQDNPALLLLPEATITEKIAFLESQGIQAEKAINMMPQIVNLGAENIVAKMDFFISKGLDPARVVNRFPRILGVAPETLEEKYTGLVDLGLNAKKIVSSSPGILCLATASIAAKLKRYEAMGLDAIKIVNQGPTLLARDPEALKAKLRKFAAAAKMDGVEDPEGFARHIANNNGVILSSKSDKIRTLLRILAQYEKVPLTDAMYGSLVILKVDQTLASHLEAGDDIKTRIDFMRYATRRRNQKVEVGKAALGNLMAAHPNDPAVRAYLRGYGDETVSSEAPSTLSK